MKRLNVAIADGSANILEYVAAARNCTKTQAIEYVLLYWALDAQNWGDYMPLTSVMMQEGAGCYDVDKVGMIP